MMPLLETLTDRLAGDLRPGPRADAPSGFPHLLGAALAGDLPDDGGEPADAAQTAPLPDESSAQAGVGPALPWSVPTEAAPAGPLLGLGAGTEAEATPADPPPSPPTLPAPTSEEPADLAPAPGRLQPGTGEKPTPGGAPTPSAPASPAPAPAAGDPAPPAPVPTSAAPADPEPPPSPLAASSMAASTIAAGGPASRSGKGLAPSPEPVGRPGDAPPLPSTPTSLGTGDGDAEAASPPQATPDTPRDPSAAPPEASRDARPLPPPPVSGASPATSPAAPVSLAPVIGPVLLPDGTSPDDLAEPTVETASLGPSLSAADGSTAGPRAASGTPLPARLAASAWTAALGAASERSVQVALGADGTVRLRTDRDGDGVTVRLHFSDPELQALAGTHAGRLREVLAEHFAEPVRLSLTDGGGHPDPSGGDANASPDRGGRPASSPGGEGPSPSVAPSTDRPPSPDGRREWVG